MYESKIFKQNPLKQNKSRVNNIENSNLQNNQNKSQQNKKTESYKKTTVNLVALPHPIFQLKRISVVNAGIIQRTGIKFPGNDDEEFLDDAYLKNDTHEYRGIRDDFQTLIVNIPLKKTYLKEVLPMVRTLVGRIDRKLNTYNKFSSNNRKIELQKLRSFLVRDIKGYCCPNDENIIKTPILQEIDSRIAGLKNIDKIKGANDELLNEALYNQITHYLDDYSDIVMLNPNWFQSFVPKITRVITGLTEMLSDIEEWRKSFIPATGGSSKIKSIKLSGSDLHKRGLGAVFVKYKITDSVGGITIKEYVIKPEIKSLEKAMYSNEPDSVVSNFNTNYKLTHSGQIINNGADKKLTTYEIKTGNHSSAIAKLDITSVDKTDRYKPTEEADIMTKRSQINSSKSFNGQRSLAFITSIIGADDLHYENLAYTKALNGKYTSPTVIDGDCAFKKLYMGSVQETIKQSGFINYFVGQKATIKADFHGIVKEKCKGAAPSADYDESWEWEITAMDYRDYRHITIENNGLGENHVILSDVAADYIDIKPITSSQFTITKNTSASDADDKINFITEVKNKLIGSNVKGRIVPIRTALWSEFIKNNYFNTKKEIKANIKNEFFANSKYGLYENTDSMAGLVNMCKNLAGDSSLITRGVRSDIAGSLASDVYKGQIPFFEYDFIAGRITTGASVVVATVPTLQQIFQDYYGI